MGLRLAGGGAPTDLHAHQLHDTDERSRPGRTGQPGRWIQRPPLWARAAVGIGWLHALGAAVRHVVRPLRHAKLSGSDLGDAADSAGQQCLDAQHQGGCAHPPPAAARVAHLARTVGAVAVCQLLLPGAVAYRHQCVFFAVPGFSGLQQNHHRPAMGCIGGGRSRLVFHAEPLAVALQPTGLVDAQRRGDGRPHAADRQQCQRSVGAGAGPDPARTDLCCTPRRVHQFAVAPLSGSPARKRAGSVYRARLWLPRCPGCFGRRIFKLKIRPGACVLGVTSYEFDSRRVRVPGVAVAGLTRRQTLASHALRNAGRGQTGCSDR